MALLDDNEKRPGSYESPGTLSRPLGKTPITGLDSFVRRPLRRVNPDSVSKVTDPETSEPLVVYHGTDKIISKTSKSKPFFVTKNAELASWFAKNRKNQGSVMPLYAAARNPFDYENEAHADLILDRLGIDTGEGYGAKTKSDLMGGDFVFIESDHVQRVINRPLNFSLTPPAVEL